MQPNISPAKLRDAFVADLAAVWDFFRKTYPDHTPYAFVLYGVEDIPQLAPQVLTEQALTEAAQKYVDSGHHDSLDEARQSIRFSVADSPLFQSFIGMLPTVDRMFEPHAEQLGETAGYRVLAKASIEAFKRLDEQALFGAGDDREQLLLMIITDDVDVDWTDKSVEQLNSAAAFKIYQDATKREPYASSEALAVSGDGKSIYAAGSRTYPDAPPEDEFISEIVAFDVVGLNVRRRWSYDFSRDGDSGRAVCCSPGAETFVALRCQYRGKLGATSILMRFNPDLNKPIHEQGIPGEPASLAISDDGRRLAIPMFDDRLVLLDESFNVVLNRPLGFTPYDALFLRSGELLVGGRKQILRIDATTGESIGIVPHPGANLSVDHEETLLASSRWFDLGGSAREKPFGMTLLSLPSFEVQRKYKLPGQQLVIPALNRNGSLLAVQSHEAGGYRKSIAVFDTYTGRQVAERKCDGHGQMMFFADNCTVAITNDGHPRRESVDLWKVPIAEG